MIGRGAARLAGFHPPFVVYQGLLDQLNQHRSAIQKPSLHLVLGAACFSDSDVLPPGGATQTLKPLNRLYFFWPMLFVFVLGMDSLWMQQHIAWGQHAALLAVVIFLALTLRWLPADRRLIVICFVVIAVIGECLFSLVFGLYEYRLNNIPVYVPLAHPILLVLAWVLIELPVFQKHNERLAAVLARFHGAVIICLAVFLGDTLSLAFGALALYVFRKRPFGLVYGLMGFIVLAIEIAGTQLGCWQWAPESAGGWLHSTNPPYGAFLGYVAADVASIKLARSMAQRWFPNIRIPAP